MSYSRDPPVSPESTVRSLALRIGSEQQRSQSDGVNHSAQSRGAIQSQPPYLLPLPGCEAPMLSGDMWSALPDEATFDLSESNVDLKRQMEGSVSHQDVIGGTYNDIFGRNGYGLTASAFHPSPAASSYSPPSAPGLLLHSSSMGEDTFINPGHTFSPFASPNTGADLAFSGFPSNPAPTSSLSELRLPSADDEFTAFPQSGRRLSDQHLRPADASRRRTEIRGGRYRPIAPQYSTAIGSPRSASVSKSSHTRKRNAKQENIALNFALNTWMSHEQNQRGFVEAGRNGGLTGGLDLIQKSEPSQLGELKMQRLNACLMSQYPQVKAACLEEHEREYQRRTEGLAMAASAAKAARDSLLR